jgi:hypothetical protein
MGIDVSLALEEGAGRLATVPGAIVAVLFVLAGFVEVAISQTIASRILERVLDMFGTSPMISDQIRQEMATSTAFDLGIGIEPAIGLFLIVFLLVIAFRVIGIRVFAAADTGGFPTEAIKYRFAVSLLFVLLFEIILVVAMLVLTIGPAFLFGAISSPSPAGPGAGGGNGGLLLLLIYLIVLGIFVVLPVLLYFARQEIVLGEKNPVSAITSSWGLAKQNFGAVFVLLALVFILNLIVGMGLGAVLGSVMIAPLVTTFFGRIISVFGIAVSTRAYLQTQ